MAENKDDLTGNSGPSDNSVPSDISDIADKSGAKAKSKSAAGKRKNKKRSAMKRGAVIHAIAEMRRNPEAIREAFETGTYPYKTKIRRAAY